MDRLLTEKEALEKTIVMWTWIAENTQLRKKPVSKQEWLGQNETEAVHSNCYLCEYSYQVHRSLRIHCETCLIKNWFLTEPENRQKTDCVNHCSPYYWYRTLLENPEYYRYCMDNIDESLLSCEQSLGLMPGDPVWKKAAAYAGAIVRLAQEALNSLNDKTKGEPETL